MAVLRFRVSTFWRFGVSLPMPLLIDTYNVVQTVGILPPDLAGIDVDGLIALLAQSRYRDEKINLVCDGVPPQETVKKSKSQIVKTDLRADNVARVSVRYSGHGRSADDLIAQMIQASTAPRRLIVVSSDQAVLRSAKRRRCVTLTSHEFLQQLVDDARGRTDSETVDVRKPRQSDMSQEQIERWIKVFDLDQQMIAIPPRARVGSDLKPKKRSKKSAAASKATKKRHEAAAPAELAPLAALPQELIDQAELLWKQQAKWRRASDEANSHD